jgi:predicted acetyltransferase
VSQAVYRPIDTSDIEQYVAIGAQAWDEAPDASWVTPTALEQLRGLFVGGELVARLRLLPLDVMNGTSTTRCGGLDGVAVPPPQRRRGYAQTLLRHVCNELRDTGVASCMLFPAYAAFYHRFGWAYGMERRVYTGTPAQLRHFAKSDAGNWSAVYSGALRGRWGPLVRQHADWEQYVLPNSSLSQPRYYAYVWRDTAGTPRAYLIYRFDGAHRYTRILRVREAVALDPVARSQIFALLADHADQCAEWVLPAPADAPVGLLMIEPLRCAVEPYFMLRAVDVASLLATYPCPKAATGDLTIAVSDDWLGHNQGTFALEVADGNARCQRLAQGGTADVACNVRVLTQMATRYLRPRTAAAFGLLTVHNRMALRLLDELFGGLAPFCSDRF